MIEISNSIVVRRPADLVWSILTDVTKWPRISSNFTQVEILMQQGERQLTAYMATHGSTGYQMLTIREKFRDGVGAYRMTFHHIKPAFPIKHHDGEWKVSSTGDDETVIKITHRVELYIPLVGNTLARIFADRRNIGPHTRKMLAEISVNLENWDSAQDIALPRERRVEDSVIPRQTIPSHVNGADQGGTGGVSMKTAASHKDGSGGRL